VQALAGQRKQPTCGRAPRHLKVASYGVLGWWCGPLRFLELPIILVGPMLGCMCLLVRSSTVEVAASPPAVRLGPELAFQLHQAPDPGAVNADIRLYFGG
jgi:hypothetical protein